MTYGTIEDMKRTYLDWAAAAPVSVAAISAFSYALRAYGNPSSPHAEGRAAKEVLEDARVRIARLAGTKSDAVLFTSGATEANALAILGHARALVTADALQKDIHVLYLPTAHASTREAVQQLAREGFDIEELVLSDWDIGLKSLRAQIRPQTALVVLESVCGETGTRFSVRDVRRVLDAARTGGPRIRLHVDASQSPLAEPFELTRLGADTLSLDAQKVGGVRGMGVLIAPRQVPLTPLYGGGGQERGMRPGTEAHAAAAAFATVLEAAQEGRVRFSARAARMRERFLRDIAVIADLSVNEGDSRVAHILNLSLVGRDTDYLATLLDEAGFAVSTRSACATDEDGSRSVLAFTGDATRAASTLRVSWGPTTHERDLARLAQALVRTVRFLDENRI